MTWRLAGAVASLRNGVNARWPNRDTASDGTIGNAEHAARSSDHNPWVIVQNVGVVRALDIDVDGIDAAWYAESIRQAGAAGDIRLNPGGYVIFNRRIAGAHTNWQWRVYTGVNPHTSHVHVSVSTVGFGFDSTAAWGFLVRGGDGGSTPVAPPPGVSGFPLQFPPHYFGDIKGDGNSHGGWAAWEKPHIRAIQGRLIVLGFAPARVGRDPNRTTWDDGKFEGPTITAVKAFQRARGLAVDGKVGPATWGALFR